MNLNRVQLFIFTLLLSCNSNNQNNYNLKQFVGKNDCIVISCLKCNCVIDELNAAFSANKNILNGYDILVDSNCRKSLNPEIKTIHINQSTLDSASIDFYNMCIIKHLPGSNKPKYYLIETAESKKIKSLLIGN